MALVCDSAIACLTLKGHHGVVYIPSCRFTDLATSARTLNNDQHTSRILEYYTSFKFRESKTAL